MHLGIITLCLQISVGLSEDSFVQPQRFLNTAPVCLMSPGNTGEFSPRLHTLQPHITLPILFEYYHMSGLEGGINVVKFILLKAFLSVYSKCKKFHTQPDIEMRDHETPSSSDDSFSSGLEWESSSQSKVSKLLTATHWSPLPGLTIPKIKENLKITTTQVKILKATNE